MNRVAPIVGLLSLLAVPALAEPRMGPMVPDTNGRIRTYQIIDDEAPVNSIEDGGTAAAPAIPGISHTIYLNNCKPAGCPLTPGSNNAPQNRSSVVRQNSTIGAFNGSDAIWQQVVQCVKETYMPFNVNIVTERPPGGNYHMAIVGGTPAQAQQQNGVLGVSPFSCGFIENSVSFTFANVLGPTAQNPITQADVPELCWTVAQETAHSWGLDHKFDNRDPMTYLGSGPQFKRFQNQAGSCGEYEARACQCGGSSMNSYQDVMDTFGPAAPDTVPPTVLVSAPVDGSNVEPGFAIRATISDDIGISEAEAKVDGMSVGKVYAFPWVWNAPATLNMGSHRVEVTAKDLMGNPTKVTLDVVYGARCTSPAECSGDGDTCVDGRCVPGSGQPGGLGEPCTGNEQCASNQCASDGTNSVCVESCDPAAQACPSGFGCVETGAGAGVCFPGADGGGGGCLAAGGSPAGPIVFGLAFAGLALTRRRRK